MPCQVLSVYSELKRHAELASLQAESAVGTRGAAADAVLPLHDALMLSCVRAENLAAARALQRELEASGVSLGPMALDALVSLLIDEGSAGEAVRLHEAGGHTAGHSARSSVDLGAELELGELGEGHAVLDLRALPDGAARVGMVRFLERLGGALAAEQRRLAERGAPWAGEEAAEAGAEAMPSQSAELPDASLTLLAGDDEHGGRATALIETAAAMQPPLPLQRVVRVVRAGSDEGSSSEGGGGGGAVQSVLTASSAELMQWAAELAERRERERRKGFFVAWVAAHNAVWAVALLAWLWHPS